MSTQTTDKAKEELKEKPPLGRVIVITSGKGGVGKTTSAAAISAGLAKRGHKTVVIDFDVGLRNLDMIMGCERRVVFDFINVIQGDARLKQALIKDKRVETLQILPTSQTRDKDALTQEGVEAVLNELKQEFDYIVCDSPAGIERGAQLAMYFADEAVVVTNPEVSSVRDSDRVLGLLASKTQRAEKDGTGVKAQVLLTRHDQARIDKGEMMTVEDVLEILAVPLLGIVPESPAVLRASNVGTPVTLDDPSSAGRAYEDAVARLLGEKVEMKIEGEKKPGLLGRIFGRTA
ncbi:septum site-determining protein MinD [Thioclava sp. GXIMD2076]|uniref:Septum site-determining protein MinD n=1 Tax=Thioclava kandeliae TaxID=3070818 RepID=A0ABV1SIV9_9RHOB